MSDIYETPTITTLGSVEEMTASLDKVGSAADAFTPQIPELDGEVQPDPRP
jgi:hypothetical protein